MAADGTIIIETGIDLDGAKNGFAGLERMIDGSISGASGIIGSFLASKAEEVSRTAAGIGSVAAAGAEAAVALAKGAADGIGGIVLAGAELAAGAFGKVSEAGKETGSEIGRLRSDGFIPLLDISNKTGDSLAVLRKCTDAGVTGFVSMKKSMGDAADEGGRFFDTVEMNGRSMDSQINAFSVNMKGNIDSVIDCVSRADFPGIGMNIAKGMADGLRNWTGTVVSAASDLANSVLAVIKGIAGIQSPSRITKGFGRHISEGLALGIAEGAKMAERAALDSVCGVMGRFAAVPAFAAGGSQTTVYFTQNNDNHISGGTDIEYVNRKLAQKTQQNMRGLGVTV